MYVGLSEGLVWTFWNQSRTDRQDEWSGKTVATLIWGSATAGAIVGGAIGSTSGTTPGRASFIGSAALWGGLVAGMGVAALHEENYAQDDAALLGAGIGMNAGVVGPCSPPALSRPPSRAFASSISVASRAGSCSAGSTSLRPATAPTPGRRWV